MNKQTTQDAARDLRRLGFTATAAKQRSRALREMSEWAITVIENDGTVTRHSTLESIHALKEKDARETRSAIAAFHNAHPDCRRA